MYMYMYICIYVYMYIGIYVYMYICISVYSVYSVYNVYNVYKYIYQMIRIMSRYSNHRCSTRDLCGLFKKRQIVASVIESHSLCPSEDPFRVRGTGLEHHDAGAVGAGIQQQRSGFWMFSNRNAIGIDPRISQIIPK